MQETVRKTLVELEDVHVGPLLVGLIKFIINLMVLENGIFIARSLREVVEMIDTDR